jgi:hypothetical protein
MGGVWAVLHVYLAARLLPGLGLGWLGFLALALVPFVVFIGLRSERAALGAATYWLGFTAMGLSSILIVLVLASDLLLMRFWGMDGRTLSLGLFAGAAALTLLGGLNARWPRVVRVRVPIAGLPGDLEGFRIAQISDLHVGPTIKRRFVAAVVQAVNALEPDVVAFTGDVADGRVASLRHEVAPLALLEARYGKYFVTGITSTTGTRGGGWARWSGWGSRSS